jgi:uncharacterized protein YndB with AHSA1/START domain
MNSTPVWTPDPSLDLVLERVIDVPRDLVWAAWTEPEHLKHWFCPKPWGVSHAEIDLRPGGIFKTVMVSPEGIEHPNVGCFLDVVPLERLVWTDALLPGYRPSGTPFMTGSLTLHTEGAGTRYVASAIHADIATRDKHEAMGFHGGWATALDQLIAYVKTW